MPHVRPGFGSAAFSELHILVREAILRRWAEDAVGLRMARSAADTYVRYHEKVGAEIPPTLAYVHEIANGATSVTPHSAVLHLSRQHIVASARGDFANLVAARHSTRMFSAEPVDQALLEESVAHALRTPSVCNRQGGRVYILRDPEALHEALEIQGGTRGFSEEIRTLLIVTCSLEVFRGGRERNQAWVDGGLFAMTLIYALTYVGLGSCPLNWSSSPRQDRKLRHLLELPEEEIIIMMIAVGHLLPEFTVAASPRRPLSEVLSEIKQRT